MWISIVVATILSSMFWLSLCTRMYLFMHKRIQIKSNQRFLSYICEINISRGKCQITLRLSFGFSVSQWVTQTETMSAVCLGALLAEKLLQERKKAPKKGKLVFVEPWPLFLDECFHLLLTPCWLLRHIWNIFVSCTSLDSHWTVLWCSG